MKLTATTACLLAFACCQGQLLNQKVSVTGTMDSAAGQPLYLIERSNATSNTESVVILDSTFTDAQGGFTLSAAISEAKYLSVLGKQPGWSNFLAEPGQEYRLTGRYNEIWKSKEHLSLTNRLLAELDSTISYYQRSNEAFADSVKRHQDNSPEQKKYRLAYDINKQTQQMVLHKFVYRHSDNIAAVFTLRQMSSQLTTAGMERFYKLLKGRFGQHSVMRQMEAVLNNPVPQKH